MSIALLVEGKNETAFMPHLRGYLEYHLATNMPRLDPLPYDGRIPTGDKLKPVVERLLNDRQKPADHIIALTDVYTARLYQPQNPLESEKGIFSINRGKSEILKIRFNKNKQLRMSLANLPQIIEKIPEKVTTQVLK